MKKLDNDYVFVCENLEEEMKLIDEFVRKGYRASSFQKDVLNKAFQNDSSLFGVVITNKKFYSGSIIIFPIKGIKVFFL